jgi:gliding motility-associated peptidyl-prolyl isomerase
MKTKVLLVLLLGLVSCQGPNPRRPVMHKSSTFFKESVNFNKSLIEQEELAFKIFMENDSPRKYEASPKGFWYSLPENRKSKVVPTPGDEVSYTFEVYDLENTRIYAKSEIGERNYVIDQQEHLEGLRLGLKLMEEGEEGLFLFPSHLVYGYLGDSDKIGINEPLIIKIQLLNIKKKNEND